MKLSFLICSLILLAGCNPIYDFINDDVLVTLDESGGGPLEWSSTKKYSLPLKEYIISSNNFAKQRSDGKYHLGEDAVCNEYTDLYAIGDGEIVYSSYRSGNGNWGGVFILQVNDGNAFFVVYGHVDKSSLPELGKKVKKDDKISKVEATSVHPYWKTHLHFQIGKGIFKEVLDQCPPGYSIEKPSDGYWISPTNYLSSFESIIIAPSLSGEEKYPKFSGKYYDEWQGKNYLYSYDQNIDSYNFFIFDPGRPNLRQSFENFKYNIPSDVNIKGIKVNIIALVEAPNKGLLVQLYNPRTCKWTSNEICGLATHEKKTYTGGSGDYLWGDSWVPSDFNNENFAINVSGIAFDLSATMLQCNIYEVYINIYY